MNKNAVIITIFVVLAVLHQDFWNWDNSNLVFGIMPVTLAYHAAYSLIAALFWYLVMVFAWPTRLEEWADGGDPPVAAPVNNPQDPDGPPAAVAKSDAGDEG